MPQSIGRHGRVPIIVFVTCTFAAAWLMWVPNVSAQSGTSGPSPSEAHFRIPDPADLSGERAESIYSAIKMSMRDHYAESGDPIAFRYLDWKRYNRVPYRSSQHGNNYINNYANETAKTYGRYENAG